MKNRKLKREFEKAFSEAIPFIIIAAAIILFYSII